MDEATLTIGQLAQRFGLKTSAIRYYERIGVLPEPARESEQRRYDADAVKRLDVLEVAKRAGFTLDDARLLLQRSDAGLPAFDSLRELAARRLPEVELIITRAEAMRDWLQTATHCTCATLDACALFVLPHEADGSLQAPDASGARST